MGYADGPDPAEEGRQAAETMAETTQRTRAEQLIAQADIDAERLIGVARVAVAALVIAIILAVFAAVGDVMPDDVRERAGAAGVRSVPFLLMGLVSIAVARPGVFRPWMAWAFATGDVLWLLSAPLYALLATDVGVGLALASPAAMAFGVVVSLQALRYRPGLQLYVSALLIGFLAAAFLLDDHSGLPASLTTTDFFSRAPNLVRVAILGILAGVISVAVWRSRRLLFRIAEETERRHNITRFLPAEIAGQMSDAGLARLRAGHRRDLVILFVDLRGFTAFSDSHSPEDAAALLTRFRALVLDAAGRHGGVVDKFIGDGALIVFGLEDDAGDHARQGYETALAITEEMGAWSRARAAEGLDPIRAVVAVHRGEAIIGAIGDARRLEFSAIGRVVNEAARLETVAKTENQAIVVSADVFQGPPPADPRRAFTPLPEQSLRGRTTPITVYGSA